MSRGSKQHGSAGACVIIIIVVVLLSLIVIALSGKKPQLSEPPKVPPQQQLHRLCIAIMSSEAISGIWPVAGRPILPGFEYVNGQSIAILPLIHLGCAIGAYHRRSDSSRFQRTIGCVNWQASRCPCVSVMKAADLRDQLSDFVNPPVPDGHFLNQSTEGLTGARARMSGCFEAWANAFVDGSGPLI